MVTTTCLPFSSSTLRSKSLGVLASQLEDVANLDAASEFERTGAVWRGIARAHVGALDGAVAVKVAARGEFKDVLAGRVGAGYPACTRNDARVEQVRDRVVPPPPPARPADRCLRPQGAWADVALDQFGVRLEVVLGGRLDAGGASAASRRVMSASRSPGRPTTTRLRSPVGARTASTTFLSVSAAVHARSARGSSFAGRRANRSSACPACPRREPPERRPNRCGRHGRGDRLDVGRVAAGPSARTCPRRWALGSGTPRTWTRPSRRTWRRR